MLKACLQSFPVLHIGNSFQQHFSVALAYTVASRNRDDACPFAYTVPFQHSCRNAAFEQCLIHSFGTAVGKVRIISAASPCIGVAGNQEAGVGIAFQKPGQPVEHPCQTRSRYYPAGRTPLLRQNRLYPPASLQSAQQSFPLQQVSLSPHTSLPEPAFCSFRQCAR